MLTTPPLHDPAWWAGDPFPTFAELRRTDPVHRYEGEAGELWMITRHADVQRVAKDPATFCSGEGVLLTDLTRPVLGVDSILYLDPPVHARQRKLVSPSLSVRRVAELEPQIRAMTTALLDAIDPTQPVDLVEVLSAPLPLMVIARLVGVPDADLDDFRRWSEAVMAAATAFTDEVVALSAELYRYIDALVRARFADPEDDLVSVLAHGEVDGERLDEHGINMFVMSLLVAGNDTTRNLISHGLEALARFPSERRRLVDDPGGAPCAVEELLRWEPSIMSFCRTATRDAEVGGTPIAAGDHVLLCYQSANRDDDVFGPTAEVVDVRRDPNPHLSFGYAEHYCMGAGLARLEGRIVLEEVLAHFPDYEVVGPMVHQPSTLARSVAHLPILFDAA
jgi:cytochrome P450